MKKLLSLLLVAILSVSGLMACAPKQEKKEAKEMYKPIWLGDTMYEESLVLVKEADGTIKGKLLYEPTEIIRVNNYTLEKTFEPSEYSFLGKDFIASASSTMPFFTSDQYYNGNDAGFLDIKTHEAKNAGEKILFTESAGLVKFHVNVTYKHKGEWANVKPTFKGEVLANTIKKLTEKNADGSKSVSVFMTGDSIAAGANSSSNLNIEPRRPSFGAGFAMELEEWYGAEVDFNNKAVGGWLSRDGAEKIESLMNDDYKPDLAILAFGMNDGAFQIDPGTYESNIRTMIETIKVANPSCEFILIGTIKANPLSPQDRTQATYLPALNSIAADTAGCVVMDMTNFSDELYKHKRGLDFLSNNINHPSDFLMRCYIMNLMAVTCKGYL